MLEDYYRNCLKPQYRFGYTDIEGRGNSESQSYALLQSFWMDDKKTFDRVWLWTQRNLQREEDNLFSWDFELKNSFINFPFKKANIKDENPATDADTDIAYALLLAGEKWKDDEYIEEAKKIINGIWEQEVTEHQGRLYLLPGNWAVDEQRIVINPSYFSPVAFQLFARYDSNHDWNKLYTDSYLNLKDIQNQVNRGEKNILPTNWVVINKSNNMIHPFEGKPDSYDYSYDAFRTLWRAGFHQQTSPSFPSWEYISAFRSIFEADWNDDQNLCTLYHYRNQRLECNSSTTGLAGIIGALSVTNGYVAEQIIKKHYIHENTLSFPENSFYGGSWHWFAAWLWTQT